MDGQKRTGDAADTVDDIVNHLLANGVVATGVVVGGILLAADQQLGVEQLAVATSSDLVNGGRVEVDEEGSRDVFAIASLGKERLVGSSVDDILGVGVRTTIGAEAVLEEVAARWRSVHRVFHRIRKAWDEESRRTAPKQSYPAGYRPGRGEGEESGED